MEAARRAGDLGLLLQLYSQPVPSLEVKGRGRKRSRRLIMPAPGPTYSQGATVEGGDERMSSRLMVLSAASPVHRDEYFLIMCQNSGFTERLPDLTFVIY